MQAQSETTATVYLDLDPIGEGKFYAYASHNGHVLANYGPFETEDLAVRFMEYHYRLASIDTTGCPDQALEDFASCAVDPFSDEALGQRTPEAIAQDDRQAADFAGFDPQYHAALVVIANEPGAGRFARAINLVAAIFGKTSQEVLTDAVMVA